MNETVSIIIWIILKGEAAGYHRKIGHEIGAEATNKAPHAIPRRTGLGTQQLQYLQGVFQTCPMSWQSARPAGASVNGYFPIRIPADEQITHAV
jgi:hypothetical protein